MPVTLRRSLILHINSFAVSQLEHGVPSALNHLNLQAMIVYEGTDNGKYTWK